MIFTRDPLTPEQREAVLRVGRPVYHGVIKWTDLGCGDLSVGSGGYYATREEAQTAALKRALEREWTLPNWWQWWRRHDTRAADHLERVG